MMGALFGFGILSFAAFFLVVVLIYVPLVLYLLNLHRCFDAIRPEFRPPVPAGLVWLTLVPGLGLLVLIVAVVMLSTALKKEDEARHSATFGDGGLAVGLAAAILGLLTVIPFLGPLLALASLVCWILHWVKVSGFRQALAGIPPAPGAQWPGAQMEPSLQPPAYTPPPPAPSPAAASEEATVRYSATDNAKLVCIVGVVQGMSFPVNNGVIIGRSAEANVVVPDSQVSNRHAWVGPVSGRLVLRDLQSTNGTFLNDHLGAPVQEVELKDGDLVVLGKHNHMKFRVSFA